MGRHLGNFQQMYHHLRNAMKTGRPIYKPPMVSGHVLWAFRNKPDPVRVMDKDTTVLPEFVGRNVLLHVGNDWVPKRLTDEMIGLRLGEFVQCHKRVIHKKKGDQKQALLLQRLKKRG